ncbi:MAG: hypothetical protein WC966_06615 [Bradymonadales bacterium]|jgi:hypothetical protein
MNSKVKRLADLGFCLTAAFGLTACYGVVGDYKRDFELELTGRVVNEAQEPIQGVEVWGIDLAGKTDSEGKFMANHNLSKSDFRYFLNSEQTLNLIDIDGDLNGAYENHQVKYSIEDGLDTECRSLHPKCRRTIYDFGDIVMIKKEE